MGQVSIPQAVSTVATGNFPFKEERCYLSVSIPQAVSTVATREVAMTTLVTNLFFVSIPQAVSTVATGQSYSRRLP